MMKTATLSKTYYLHPGNIFARAGEYIVSTILGSCVAVCLWDSTLRMGGISHYMLALWNGEGLPCAKYGNIAVTELIVKMLESGSRKGNLYAKIFGGAEMHQCENGILNVGHRNIELARDMLKEERIPIIKSDVGGSLSRRIIFNTESGLVLVKKIRMTSACLPSHQIHKKNP